MPDRPAVPPAPADRPRAAREGAREGAEGDTRQVRGPEWGEDPHGTARREPLLPHDRDESAHGTQAGGPSEVGLQAHADASSGMPDTDRKPVMEEVYERQRAGDRPRDGVAGNGRPAR